MNGIGERAGNCSLEEIAMIVRTRGQALGVQHDLNIKEIVRTSRLVAMTTGYSVQPNKAVVGLERVRARERDPPARRAQQPRHLRDHGPGRDRAGGQRASCWASTPAATRSSTRWTRSASRWTTTRLNRAFARFKDLADRKMQLTDQDLAAIVAEELGAADEDVLVLESVVVGGGTAPRSRAPRST